MAYVITSNLAMRPPAQPTTAEAFREAEAARDRLSASLAIEEAFAVLVANYVSFEAAVAAANVDNMVERSRSEIELTARRREIDRHIVNLLAVGEMFSDHVNRRIVTAFGRRSSERDALDAAVAVQRDKLPGFRAAELLRDAVLHYDLPVTSWTFGGSWVGAERPDGRFDKSNGDARLEYSVTFAFAPGVLRGREADREAVIMKLQARADANGNVSWVPILREYVEALSIVLEEVRSILKETEQVAASVLENLGATYRAANDLASSHDLFAVELADDGSWARRVYLTFGFEAALTDLRRRHRPMVNLHRRVLRG